ncbi:hypothetical protein ABZX77_37525 [Streptomyces sp. NPDC004237]|uniref:hypothetical protein n=1 Tax=Streptomyces sp. NPDC004237 TaxID=3154455 RepID=UPI0033BBA0A9
MVVAALTLAACSATPQQGKKDTASSGKSSTVKVADWTCGDGTLHWGKVTTEGKLVAVSQLVRATKDKQQGNVTYQANPVRDVTAHIDASAKVSDETVIASLTKKLGLDGQRLARSGESVPVPKGTGFMTADMKGKTGDYLALLGVQVVEASFVLGCAANSDKPVYGTVTTWYGKSQGMIKCGRDAGTYPGAREAHDLLCGEEPQA